MNVRGVLLWVVVALCWGLAANARAQVFSPGALSRSHAALEGVGDCMRCHVEAGQHDNSRCLECHKEIGRRQARGDGYHARVKGQQCAECHREHRGASASLINWGGNWGGNRRNFNHSLTGWPLKGAHAKPDCKSCHDARRVVDDDIRAILKKTERESYLGVPSTCASCHFDEHRDQEGDRCEKCHTTERFAKAPLFSHNRDSKFPLTGRHKQVACTRCHQEVTDDDTPADAFPAPRDRTYLQLTDIPHASCVACHEDIHHGQLGRNCTQCHSTDGWKNIKQSAEDFGFHDKTAFPLRGEHTSVACKSCHGPFPGERATFKGLAHKRCADCHIDAHAAQLKNDDGDAPRCDRCHTVNGFLPVLFDGKLHQGARFALEGSHKAVACNLCHKDDARLLRQVPAQARRMLEKRKRRVLLSDVRLALPEVTGRCETCHTDPHGGQFDARIKDRSDKGGCQGCHQPSSFIPSTFSHDDSRFPLTGKHVQVTCGSCHAADETAKGKLRGVVMYRPVPTACAGCHADTHLAQLAEGGVTACQRCHDTTGFVPSRFVHNDPAFSRFPLEGKHVDVKCDTCHPRALIEGKAVARYKPLPRDCAGCHADEHNGRFDAFVP